eukprot:1273185-Rhodomonas_salina.1
MMPRRGSLRRAWRGWRGGRRERRGAWTWRRWSASSRRQQATLTGGAQNRSELSNDSVTESAT